jgi:NAD(P)-dependent dehydrogenase (short-subunit alcohol dehydrogenase family)
MESMSGKVAAITGGASGIGLALAHRFAAAGMAVAIADVQRDALDAAATELRAAGATVLPVALDVTDAQAVADFAALTVDELGGAHVVCANAGVGGAGDAWFGPLTSWEWVVNVNLWGVVHTVRAFLPTLVAQDEGHIVTTASMAGLTASAGMAPYNATKHAVVGLTESLFHSLRLQGSKVGVSVLCPGWVRTNILDSTRNWPAEELGTLPAANPAAAGNWELFRKVAEDAIANGLDPAALADQVADAIRTGRFWILTHSEMAPFALERMRRAVAGENPG